MNSLIKTALIAVALAASIGTASAATSYQNDFAKRFFQELNERGGG